MPADLSRLKELPSGVEQGTTLIAGFDQCLLLGFARLGPVQHEALEAVAAVFAGSPLYPPLTGAVGAVKRSEFLAKYFGALAAGRTAIQGSQYDALFLHAAEATGRKVPDAGTEMPKRFSPEGQQTAWLSSTQQWLMELALAGFKHLSMDTLSPFMATLEQMQAEPKLARVASLLTGFLTELLAATPATGDELPVFRWADLWARAMIAAQQPPQLETGVTASGTLHPLGVDVRTHAHFANVVIYGLLETGNERRAVRVPLSSYKVDVIARTEVWHLFRPAADPLLESLAAQKSLQVSGMHLLSSGDLLWTGKAKLGSAFDPLTSGHLATSDDAIGLPPSEPLARHPVQLAELVSLDDCVVRKSAAPAALGRSHGDGTTLEVLVDGHALPLATERLAGSELEPRILESATALIGLLRFDRGVWAVQPLCVRARVGKKQGVVVTGSAALAFCEKDKAKTLATLSERASKLLRQ
jgi:hypothetical protein